MTKDCYFFEKHAQAPEYLQNIFKYSILPPQKFKRWNTLALSHLLQYNCMIAGLHSFAF